MFFTVITTYIYDSILVSRYLAVCTVVVVFACIGLAGTGIRIEFEWGESMRKE